MINMGCERAILYEDIGSFTIWINGVELVVTEQQYFAILNTFDKDDLYVA